VLFSLLLGRPISDLPSPQSSPPSPRSSPYSSAETTQFYTADNTVLLSEADYLPTSEVRHSIRTFTYLQTVFQPKGPTDTLKFVCEEALEIVLAMIKRACESLIRSLERTGTCTHPPTHSEFTGIPIASHAPLGQAARTAIMGGTHKRTRSRSFSRASADQDVKREETASQTSSRSNLQMREEMEKVDKLFFHRPLLVFLRQLFQQSKHFQEGLWKGNATYAHALVAIVFPHGRLLLPQSLLHTPSIPQDLTDTLEVTRSLYSSSQASLRTSQTSTSTPLIMSTDDVLVRNCFFSFLSFFFFPPSLLSSLHSSTFTRLQTVSNLFDVSTNLMLFRIPLL